MKKGMVTVAAALLILFFGCGSEKAADEGSSAVKELKDASKSAEQVSAKKSRIRKKYDIKSGIVQFKVQDPSGTHREVLYFDDYGIKECLETYNTDGELTETKFCDGEKLYTYKNSEKTVYILSSHSGNGTEMRFDKDGFQPEQKKKYKYAERPDMTVAGKPCTAFYMETGFGKTVYAGWSHITLYHNQKTTYGDIVREAASLEENAAVPAARFAVPDGYAVEKAF